MELININTANIVFNNRANDNRDTSDELEHFRISKPFRKMISPKGSIVPKLSKSPKFGLSSSTTLKGHGSLESPSRGQLVGVSCPAGIESHESPTLKGRVHSLNTTPVLDMPQSWKEKMASPLETELDIFTPASSLSVSPYKMNAKIRAMYNAGRGKENEDGGDFSINPDPVPYQPSNFIPNRKDKLDFQETIGLEKKWRCSFRVLYMSSTVLKKYPAPRRHLDTFGGLDFSTTGAQRGLILHTDRYQFDSRAFDGMNQRERLEAELDYMERLRGIKRRREVLPHRAGLDLLMGGKKIDFTERFDIQREIQKLRSLILPQNARDLFHGRGFTLPQGHNSIQPRHTLPPDIDLEENETQDQFPSSKFSTDPETGRARPRWQKQGDTSSTTFPKINNRGHMLGGTQPAYLQRSKTNVTRAKPSAIRSLTAIPGPKVPRHRPVDTGPTVPQGQPVARDIKIPGSTRESEGTSSAGKDKKTHVDEDLEVQTVQDEGDRKQISRLSHHTRHTGSPSKAPTPNPLKGAELPGVLSQEEQDKLKETFKSLDTDSDGHLLYNQLQTQLPKQFSQTQEKFIKQVYDITSSSTFFGVDEFMTMSYLTQTVTSLSGDPLQAYETIDFNTLHETILKYVELFQSVDRSHRGKIKVDSLRNILQQTLGPELFADSAKWNTVSDIIEQGDPGMISKIEFLAYIPYFETLKSK